MSKLNSALPEQQVHPEPAFEKRSRRTFSADYKLKIIQQADNCKHAELGELLRKDRLYNHQLNPTFRTNKNNIIFIGAECRF